MPPGLDIPEFTIGNITIPSIHIGLGVLIIAAIILLVFLIFKLFHIGISIFFKFLINSLIGAALLYLSNLVVGGVFHYDALTLPINWLTASVTGVFGVPGVIVLLIIRFFSI